MAQNATAEQLAQLEREENSQAEHEQSAQDLNVLFPNHRIFINGKQLTVQEYTFVEWLQLRQQYAVFINKFTALMTEHDDVLVDDVLAFFEDEFADVQGLILASIGQSADFLAKVSANEMESLMLTWWQVNKHFFMKSVVRAMRKNTKNQTMPQSDGSM